MLSPVRHGVSWCGAALLGFSGISLWDVGRIFLIKDSAQLCWLAVCGHPRQAAGRQTAGELWGGSWPWPLSGLVFDHCWLLLLLQTLSAHLLVVRAWNPLLSGVRLESNWCAGRQHAVILWHHFNRQWRKNFRYVMPDFVNGGWKWMIEKAILMTVFSPLSQLLRTHLPNSWRDQGELLNVFSTTFEESCVCVCVCASLCASYWVCMKIKIVNWSLTQTGLILSHREHNGSHYNSLSAFSGGSTHHHTAAKFQTQ